jgi:hypothetical protein
VGCVVVYIMFQYTSNLYPSNVYRFRHNYSYVTSYHVTIDEPNKYPEDLSNWLFWRRHIDSLSPMRVSSVIYNKKGERQLLYIFDGYGDVRQFENKVLKEHPYVKIKVQNIKQHQ